jgi:single-strand selective monofunctional uracil DNA glycosylase
MSARIAEGVVAAARRLARDVGGLRFGGPVSHVYNPLDYARRPHELYLRRFGASRKQVLFVGMNPGPFGMAQTGVPFGDVVSVRDFLGIEAPVRRPRRQHEKRPILGFDCARREVSGQRLWGAVAAHFGRPQRFFARHFIANYCPLVFVESSGRNRTPDKLPRRESEPLFETCDRHLRRVVELLEPRWVVGIGAFAEARARAALDGDEILFGRILHPSPANPRAQRDWGGAARSELQALGLCAARKR